MRLLEGGGAGQGFPKSWWMTRAESQKNAIEIPMPAVRCTDSAWRRMWPLTTQLQTRRPSHGMVRITPAAAEAPPGRRPRAARRGGRRSSGAPLRSPRSGKGLREALAESARGEEHEGEEREEHGPREAHPDRGKERIVERGHQDAEPHVRGDRNAEQERGGGQVLRRAAQQADLDERYGNREQGTASAVRVRRGRPRIPVFYSARGR